MKGNAWQTALIALALALLPALLINGAYANAADPYPQSETANVNYTQNYTVDQRPDQVWNYSKSINVTQNGTQLQDETDYRWIRSDGEVNWLPNGTADNTSTATVNYTYYDHSDRTDLVAQILSWNVPWIGLLFLITAIGFLKVFAIGSGGF